MRGSGYTIAVLPGWRVVPADPLNTSQLAFPMDVPPPPNSPAAVMISPVFPPQFAAVYQTYMGLENPMVQAGAANSLGLMQVLAVAPLRQMTFNGAEALVREFDALSFAGQPVHLSAMLLRGPCSAMQTVVAVNPYFWTQWAGPALQFVSQVQLDGTQNTGSEIRSIVDPAHPQKVELQLMNEKSGQAAPVMTMPTEVNSKQVYQVVVQAGAVVHMGEIEGANVQVGRHNRMFTGGQQQSAAPEPEGSADESEGADTMSNFSNATFNNSGPSQQGDQNTMYAGAVDTKQLEALVGELRSQVEAAPLPPEIKQKVVAGPVAAMQAATKTQNPQPQLGDGLTSINQMLKSTAVAGDQLLSIAKTASSIASIAKLALPVVAPFLSGIL